MSNGNSNGSGRKWSRKAIAQLSPAEFEKHHDEIKKAIDSGELVDDAEVDADKLRLPDDYALSRREVARMTDDELAANAGLIRRKIVAGELD